MAHPSLSNALSTLHFRHDILGILQAGLRVGTGSAVRRFMLSMGDSARTRRNEWNIGFPSYYRIRDWFYEVIHNLGLALQVIILDE